MAEKRMFSKQIIDSDAFLEMPLSTQALYFHLSMRADDDGFVDNPRKIQRMINASGDDLKLLIAKRYILTFDSGVIVIKHWRIHNTLRSDRYKSTVYLEEKATLLIKDNKAYTEKNKVDEIVGIPNGNQMEPQYRLDKNSIDKDKNNVQISKADIDTLFEKLWKQYPCKRGKGQVSDAKKRKLYEIGEQSLINAIDRYKAELSKETWRKAQNGSTFFNSGYVDYLDGNFEPSKVISNNKFNNFEQRDYDYDNLEKQLLQNNKLAGGN